MSLYDDRHPSKIIADDIAKKKHVRAMALAKMENDKGIRFAHADSDLLNGKFDFKGYCAELKAAFAACEAEKKAYAHTHH